jgi:hypothetical protein
LARTEVFCFREAIVIEKQFGYILRESSAKKLGGQAIGEYALHRWHLIKSYRDELSIDYSN